jgi:curved DNA-binding protein CbpA
MLHWLATNRYPDHELFQLNDAVQLHEGPNETFYSFLGVSPKATQDEIRKAFRRKASRIHPDKAKSSFVANYGKPKKGEKTKVHKKPSRREIDAFSKEADERYKRLSVVATVLRGPGRQRYDYFLENGFPTWRGTGYYYSRYRPGLGTVLIGLLIFGGGFAHYGIMQLTYKRQRDFMDRYIRYARRMAWGDDVGIAGIPGIGGATASTGFESVTTGDEQAPNWNRKQKRMQAKEDRRAAKNPKAAKAAREKGISTPTEAEITSGPQGAKKRVVAENGKILIVDSVGNVYLEEETEDGEVHEFLLDVSAIDEPPSNY